MVFISRGKITIVRPVDTCQEQGKPGRRDKSSFLASSSPERRERDIQVSIDYSAAGNR